MGENARSKSVGVSMIVNRLPRFLFYVRARDDSIQLKFQFDKKSKKISFDRFVFCMMTRSKALIC